MVTNYKWTIRLSLLTPVLIIICIFLMGGGYGWYTPAIVLFPWSMINIVLQDHLSFSLLIIGMFQFIVYGILLDKTRGTHSQRGTRMVIFFSHIFLVALILVLNNPEWR
jgi:hypothetical protein